MNREGSISLLRGQLFAVQWFHHQLFLTLLICHELRKWDLVVTSLVSVCLVQNTVDGKLGRPDCMSLFPRFCPSPAFHSSAIRLTGKVPATPGSMGMRSTWIGEGSPKLCSQRQCEEAHFRLSLPHSVLANTSTFVNLITRE